jgi:alginate O-acetyltransferase complex protein AlgI
MEFNSLLFLLFFGLVTLLYHQFGKSLKPYFLLIVSCFFYMAFKPVYILILVLTIAVDYYAAIKIQQHTGTLKKRWYIFSIVITCAILFVFKYFNFFTLNIIALADVFHIQKPWTLMNILLPIGLSFHTFQSLSYVSEVYYGGYKPERNFWIYSLYVMFYPQLVAGPIERPQGLLDQLKNQPKTTANDIYSGLLLMLWGFFKKLCIADRLADFVNLTYANPNKHNSIEIALAIIFFGIQIYCDFSAYSDIAIGSARTMGYKLNINFNRPYIAHSFADFWHRWHISLSTWFRDYVYIPMGGNRGSKFKKNINILTTFTISGLWHGANFTFVLWGFIHGLFLAIEKEYIEKIKYSFSKKIYTVLVFITVSLLWVLFRAENFTKAIQIYKGLFLKIKFAIPFGSGFEKVSSLAIVPFVLVLMFYMEKRGGLHPLYHFTQHKSFAFQTVFILAFIFVILSFGAFISPSSFIYFQF